MFLFRFPLSFSLCLVSLCSVWQEGLPEVYVDCAGTDCEAVLMPVNYRFCQSDSDCGTSGTTCRMFADYEVLGSKDPIGSWLWSGGDVVDSCSNTDEMALDVMRLLQALGGTGQVPLTASPTNGICQPVLADGVDDWGTWKGAWVG